MRKKEVSTTVLQNEDLYCYVKSARITPKNDFKQPLFVSAKCQFGNIKFVFWLTEKIPGFKVNDVSTWPISTGQFLKVSFVDFEKANNEFISRSSATLQGRYNSNFTYKIINEEDVSEDLVKLIKRDYSKQIEIAKNALLDNSCWKNKDCAKLLRDIIYNNKNFVKCPAAVDNHHAYEGGLLVHSYEVYNFSKAISEKDDYNAIDTDVLYLSCWLHDIGKTETYYIDEDGNCAIDGNKENLIFHAIRSYAIFKMAANKLDLNSDFIDKVSHCILSHHDRKDWDSPMEPITPEAIILARSDMISATLAKFE